MIDRRIPIGPARTTSTLVGTQLAAGVGFYAVGASLVVHLRHDVGLLAVAASAVIGVRTAVQYGLYLPAGALADRLDPARTAAIGCLIRAAGFAAMAAATRLPALTGAAVLIGLGGCVYTPAGYSILAGLPDHWARRGFAWYIATGQFSAIAGPIVGLGCVAEWGFASVAWLAAVSWAVAAVLVTPLKAAAHDRTAATPVAVRQRLRAVRGDRPLLRFALAGSPATLMVVQAAVVVPFAVPDARLTTLFLSGSAMCAATAQLPLWRPTLVRHGLWLGFGSFAVAYTLLIPVAALAAGAPRATIVGLAGVLHGLAQGALLPALFHHTRRLSPPHLTGAYFGAVSFASGMAALVGGTATGLLLDHGPGGLMTALAGLGVCAAVVAVVNGNGSTSSPLGPSSPRPAATPRTAHPSELAHLTEPRPRPEPLNTARQPNPVRPPCPQTAGRRTA